MRMLNVYVSSTKVENFYYLVDFQIICQFVGYPLKKFLPDFFFSFSFDGIIFAALQESDVQYAHQLSYGFRYVMVNAHWSSLQTLFLDVIWNFLQVVLATNRIKFVNVVSANVFLALLSSPISHSKTSFNAQRSMRSISNENPQFFVSIALDSIHRYQ